ncbi:uncharacterized protein LOC121735703 isoform X3 [Aricia agestis]|uniref:uncharacterized protein LOC121735703 isoform X3 n=1 Tax=Aricia agestis TaxID=91739 RepID=UPI001C20BF05|nr:uncharacterized protein LOC121735703 isoform X3 [Aricia agestis]XP_041982549.1 uncharacterized protein LOC121735703 isoform X3 [Aricia agestis]
MDGEGVGEKVILIHFRCKIWIEACGRPDLVGRTPDSLKNTHICSLHFQPYIYGNKSLKKTALPALLLPNKDTRSIHTQTTEALRPVTLKIDNTNETSAVDAELARENDSSDGDQDMEDDDERFGAIIAAELRSIDDPEEKETVIAAIKKVLHESRVRRRQKKQTEIEFKHESEPKPVVSVPRPIDDRTEEEKAVSSIKSEPDEPINDEIPPTDEPTPNLDCKTKTPIPMPMDDRTEEQIAVEAIKEEPVDPSYLGDSSSAFSHSEPDPLCDPAAPQPVTDITEADAAVAAIKQEPAETYEIKISDVNMGDV